MSEVLSTRVKLFACGGAGTNIAKKVENFRNKSLDGYSGLDILYIDTSGSDFDNVSPEFIYRFKERDGSGGLRKENANVISKHVQEILQNHKPLPLNIVVSSAGGGSGSVIAPTIVNELLKRGENVVVILIGAKDTRLLINNTLNTLKSYENISRSNDRSIVMKYLENESSSKKKNVDDEAIFLIAGLCLLFSGQNKHLDSKDLEHWINFNKVTTFKPQLVYLETVSNLAGLKSNGNPISVATIAPLDGDTDLERPVEVQYIGYVPDSIPQESKERLPIHFVTTDGLFEDLNKQLNTQLDELNAQSNSRVSRESFLSDDDQVNDNGLVL